ncbi:MAG: MerR family DNA-binding transcriptional regulator, partial [Sphaerochaetaceae bacterium]|nr:MerR family DNA-binding transcriptional regulator [Sphaerochaetaceae bacterium]
MREYFTVGQLSSIFNINVQTLHYYDSIGLLSPS